MGTLRSAHDHSGLRVNGITLGNPARDIDEEGEVLTDSDYRWDDSLLPNGFIEDDGTITIDEPEGI
jgi:hypothetical protein